MENKTFEKNNSDIRKQNYDEFMENLNNDEENNAKIIYNQIKRDQGKFIDFCFCGDDNDYYNGFLLTVVTTDDDYYYVYLTKDKQIRQMTCVSAYTIKENEDCQIPLTDVEIGKMLNDLFENPNSLDSIIYWGKYKID